jgi:hypothetical protein
MSLVAALRFSSSTAPKWPSYSRLHALPGGSQGALTHVFVAVFLFFLLDCPELEVHASL